ncbi:MAG: hypothetical protein PHZ19_02740 [Candidatus Thermoplasmatota archaeon]|nr:hypothetical protein [Candidatus Thermoplasmatota archaeon]
MYSKKRVILIFVLILSLIIFPQLTTSLDMSYCKCDDGLCKTYTFEDDSEHIAKGKVWDVSDAGGNADYCEIFNKTNDADSSDCSNSCSCITDSDCWSCPGSLTFKEAGRTLSGCPDYETLWGVSGDGLSCKVKDEENSGTERKEGLWDESENKCVNCTSSNTEDKMFGNYTNINELQGEIPDGDGDYIHRDIELELGLDPNNAYSYGNIHDAIRLIYDLNNDINLEQFLSKIPNEIEPIHWNKTIFGTHKGNIYTDISLVDPLFKYYADKVHIEWEDNEQYGKIGHLKLGDENLFLGAKFHSGGLYPPAYFLSRERKGICADSVATNDAIFQYMGFRSTLMGVDTPKGSHSVVEVEMNNEIYVVDFNTIYPKQDIKGNLFYNNMYWVIDKDYDTNWLINNTDIHF